MSSTTTIKTLNACHKCGHGKAVHHARVFVLQNGKPVGVVRLLCVPCHEELLRHGRKSSS